MTKADVKKRLTAFSYHFQVFILGLLNMIVGTLTVGLFALAIYGFITTAQEGGYAAVGDFLVACLNLVIALASMYLMGLPTNIRRKGGNRYESK